MLLGAVKRISIDKYYYEMGQVPPIYFNTLDGKRVNGFVVGESNGTAKTPKGIKDIYTAYYSKNDRYYKVGNVYFTGDKSVRKL